MKVIVVSHVNDDSIEMVLAEGTEFGRRVTTPALFDDQQPTPYLAELDDDVAIAVDGQVVVGVAKLGARDEPTLVAEGASVALTSLKPGLTRGPAKALVGTSAYVASFAAGTLIVLDLGDLSLEETLDRVAQGQADVDRERQLELRRRLEEGYNVFINPYTFVPFPEREPDGFRLAPAGHDRLAPDRLSGRVDLRFTAATPLLTRTSDGGFPVNAHGQPIVPGSSIKGAMRAVHEVLAGGCLRVLDGEFVPVYRDIAHVLPSSWTLAAVAEVDAGVPTKFDLCSEVVWTSADELHAAIPTEQLQSGSRVSIGRTERGNHGRTNGFDVTAGEEWVVHITAVPQSRNNHPYYAACGRLGGAIAALANSGVWERYRRVVDGTKDLQQNPDPIEVQHKPKEGPARRIGRRRAATRDLAMGDVVWVRVERDAVAEIKLSYLWRSEGAGKLADRVPKWLWPCSDDELCPTCRVFGSAEETPTSSDERAEQHSYRSHLRFADAVATTLELDEVELPPLGRPRPGVGSFYLRTDGKRVAQRGETPRARWGAADDRANNLRHVRGRKFYWNADPAQQQPRRDRRGPAQTNQNMGGAARVLPPGTELTSAIHFVNLSRTELGALVAVLQPGIALASVVPPSYSAEERPLQIRLGGAKPLGYGAVDVQIERLVLESAASRYLGAESPEATLGELIDEFKKSVVPEVSATWPDLAAVLHRDHVNPARVMYPPKLPWPSQGQPEPGKFREPFDFFKSVSGSDQNDAPHQVLPPSPRDLTQHLRIPEPRERNHP